MKISLENHKSNMIKKNNLTIIMPVYNTPIDAVERMLTSLEQQTDKEFELYIVDDGSAPPFSDYLDLQIDRFNKCTVFHRPHKGVSATRNYAIQNVKTEYIAFVDADDILSDKFVSEGKTYVTKYDVDVVFGAMKYIPETIEYKQNNNTVELYDGDDIQEVYKALLDIKPRKIKYQILGTPCARIYKTDLVKKTLFEENLSFYEDQVFNRLLLKKATSVLVVPVIWYFYIQNDFSAMHKERNIDFYKKTILYWERFYELNCLECEKIRDSLRKQQLDFFYGVVNYNFAVKKNKLLEVNRELKNIASHPMVDDCIRNSKIWTKNFTILDKFNIITLRLNAFWFVYLEKRIKYILKKNLMKGKK